jgi:hypothetical protein
VLRQIRDLVDFVRVEIRWDKDGYYARILHPDGHKSRERGGRRKEDKIKLRQAMFIRFATMGKDLT